MGRSRSSTASIKDSSINTFTSFFVAFLIQIDRRRENIPCFEIGPEQGQFGNC